MNFVKGTAIRKHPELKQSFFSLAKATFQLDFEQWDALGYWDETYCPYAFEVDNKIIANVSISIATMIVDGQAYKSVQVGTVMTDPAYQGKGLSRQLMEKVLTDVANDDIIYLFANKSVLNFYPKFGFERRTQGTFMIKTKQLQLTPTEIKKVNIYDEKARQLFYETTVHRMPISTTLGMLQNENIVMFHALTQYTDAIYYVADFQAFVIAIEQEDRFQLVDVISKHPIDLVALISALPIQASNIQLCFTPDALRVPVEKGIFHDEGAMFVKQQGTIQYPEMLLYPYSALA